MRTWLLVGFALLAVSCSGPTPPDAWTAAERQVPSTAATSASPTVCDEIQSLALGAMAGSPDLIPLLDELARIGALTGATSALPHLAEARAAVLADEAGAARAISAAATELDVASYDQCATPVFTAMYLATSYASCFGRAAVASGQLAPATNGCEPNISPDYLPCWDVDAGYIPVDCRTAETLWVVNGEWVPI